MQGRVQNCTEGVATADDAVALVLGAKVLAGGVASPVLRYRAEHAAELWHRGAVRAIVASGAERWHGPSEAAVIARICIEKGVPEAALHLEERASTTEENILFSMGFLEALGAREVLIVTDRPHSFRARLVARRQGLRVRVSCPDIPWSRRRAQAWRREMVAFIWYWAWGRGRR